MKRLAAWNLLRGDIPQMFIDLGRLRNRLIHFSPNVYGSEREIALRAIKTLSSIVSAQFGFFGQARWRAIKGTKGAQFISKAAEGDPFIKRSYLPGSPLAGPYYAIRFQEEGVLFFDREKSSST